MTAPSNYGSVYVGHSTTVSVSISAAPGSDMTVTPSGRGLTFSPAVLRFTSDGSLSQSVSVLCEEVGSAVSVEYVLGGTDASDFVSPSPSNAEVKSLGECACV